MAVCAGGAVHVLRDGSVSCLCKFVLNITNPHSVTFQLVKMPHTVLLGEGTTIIYADSTSFVYHCDQKS